MALNSSFSRVLKHGALAFLFRGFGALAAFVMTLVAARILTKDDAGDFFLAIAIVSLLAPISILGLQTLSLRLIGAAHAEGDLPVIDGFFKRSFLIAFVSAGFVASLIYLASPFLAEHVFSKPNFALILRTISPAILFLGLGILVSRQLQAIGRTGPSVYILSIGVPTLFCVLALFTTDGNGLLLSLFYVISAVVNLALGVYIWRLHVPDQNRVVQRAPKQSMLSACGSLWIVSVMELCILWSGQIFSGIWAQPSDLADLSVAQRTANLVSMIFIAINLIIAPRIAGMYKQGRMDELKTLVRQSVRLIVAVSLPALLLLVLLSDRIMLLFGPKFISAGSLLVILSFGQLVNAATGPVGYLLTMTGHEKDMRNVTLWVGASSIFFGALLTNKYGVYGAAFSTAAAVAIQNLSATYIVKKRLGFNPLSIF